MTETEYLDSRKVSRSAYADRYVTGSSIYLGVCEEHNRPVRFDTAPDGGAVSQHRLIPCPVGEHLIKGERLVAVLTELTCDGSCRSARRPSCECGCGGVNHGNTWTRGAMLGESEMVESELVKYRAEQVKIQQKREVKREAAARREQARFEAWAADHQDVIRALEAHKPDGLGNPQPGSNLFLTDLARQLFTWDKPKPLTENQEYAALRTIADQERRVREQAKREAAKRPCPEGNGTGISGEIVKVKVSEGYAGAMRYQAVVACDGYAVFVTVPSVVTDWARAERSRVVYVNRPSYNSYNCTDWEAISYRWTKALKGVRLSFTAEISRSERDESFGFAKRPVKVSFTTPETS